MTFNHKSPPWDGPRMPVTPAFLVAVFILLEFSSASAASLESRLTTGWEYDDNVLEDPSLRNDGGAGTVSLFSTARFNSASSASRLDLQAGYKAHHRIGQSDSVTAGDVLVHRISAETERRAGSSILGASGEIKLRNVYRKNSLRLLSEEGYVRGQGQLYIRHRAGGLGILSVYWRQSFFNFETFETFNHLAFGPRLRLTRRLGERLAGALEYGFTRRNCERPVSRPTADGAMETLDVEQRDNLHQLDLTLSYGSGWLVNCIYTLQHNGSNNFGFSYWNNRFSFLFGHRLPGDAFLNAYLFFELRRYSDKTSLPILTEAITEENDNNGAVIKLSRPLCSYLDASLAWSLYRNQSSLRDLDFRKNLIDCALTWRF